MEWDEAVDQALLSLSTMCRCDNLVDGIYHKNIIIGGQKQKIQCDVVVSAAEHTDIFI